MKISRSVLRREIASGLPVVLVRTVRSLRVGHDVEIESEANNGILDDEEKKLRRVMIREAEE